MTTSTTNKPLVTTRKPEQSAEEKAKILEAFLDLAGESGWCDDTLIQAALQVKKTELDVWALFPDKSKDALQTWSRLLDHDMSEKLRTLKLEDMRVRERIFWGVRTRLTLMGTHKKTAKAAFYFILKQGPSTLGLQLLYDTVHLIWSLAGDQSLDMNFYSKRFLLAGVYVSTFLYWLKDQSPEHHNTWKFLETRINNVLSLGKLKALDFSALTTLAGHSKKFFAFIFNR